MAMIKCKMCGGDLNVTEGMTVAECEYCGTRQTVPSADSEKKTSLFLRANKLRFDCDFDRAANIYDSIITDFPAEPEAYWGLVLCKYGIEYVDDPATGKKVPTCHRSSYESVLEDENLEKVMEYADAVARRVYREEAKAIEDIRKGILEVSGKEPPYDIFICYKETGENGERTVDSVLAQDVYDALTEKGYRVFFSRITLEDKLGTEYEPYIFAALNSAKVMLVFGTDYEYFNAVWVKNEWSRYLKLMAQDKSKHLIPCYKNVDAYDMPKEFQKLQGQDMGKVGALQDLLRGIDKLLGKGQAAQAAAQTSAQAAGGPTADSLLKRGQLFLEDGDWKKANEYFDKVLDINPECAEAYVGKFCAARRYRDISDMAYDGDFYTTGAISSDSVIGKILELSAGGSLIQAIKFYREQTGAGLSEAKAAVEQIVASNGADVPDLLSGNIQVNIMDIPSNVNVEMIRSLNASSLDTGKLQAINYYRERTKADLATAKAAVEQILATSPAAVVERDRLAVLEKALRFASPELREQLEGYEAAAKQVAREQEERRRQEQEKERLRRQEEKEHRQQEERRRQEREKERLRRQEEEERRRQEEALQKARKQKEDMLESAYINACNMERDAHSDESLQDAEDAFRSLGNYKDSMEKYQLCRQRRLEPSYIKACRLQESAYTEEDFSTAEYSFYLLGDYKDSPARKKMCHEASLKAGRESLRQELASLRGFFTGKRRKEIEARLAEIEAELKKL